MSVFDRIAERKIVAAIERGELSDLPGQGAPLQLDDDALIAPHLRMAYRILRNAGYVPTEVQTRREIYDLERYIDSCGQGKSRALGLRKLQLLRLRLEASGQSSHMLHVGARYAQKLQRHFAKDDDNR